MDVANKNMFAVIGGKPFVHLYGHVSLHFDIVRKRFDYYCTSECEENVFMESCKKYGYQYKVSDGNISIWGGNTHDNIKISADGKVTVNGKLFSIEMQIKNDRNEDYKEELEKAVFKISTLERLNETHTNQIDNLCEEIEKLKKTISQKDMKINTLTGQIEAFERCIAILSDR